MIVRFILKPIARAAWAGIGPFRRPLVRKFHAMLDDRQRLLFAEIDRQGAEANRRVNEVNHRVAEVNHRVAEVNYRVNEVNHRVAEVNHQVAQIAGIDQRVGHQVHAMLAPATANIQDLDIVLDSMVRELTRLQEQVEVVQQKLDEQSPELPVVRLGTIDGADASDPDEAGNSQRPLTVGFDAHWDRKSG